MGQIVLFGINNYFRGKKTQYIYIYLHYLSLSVSHFLGTVTNFEETSFHLSTGESFANVVQGLDQITSHSAANAAIVQQDQLFRHVLMLPGAKHQK